jgi:hypothetical protein
MTDDETNLYAVLIKPDTNNATWFNSHEKGLGAYWNGDEYFEGQSNFLRPRKKDFYKHLGQLNDGLRHGKYTNSAYLTYRDNKDLIEQVPDHMELNQRQLHLAKRYFTHVRFRMEDVGMTNITGIRKDGIAIAVCMYVVEKDENDIRRFEPEAEVRITGKAGKIKVKDHLASEFNIPAKSLNKTYGKVKSRAAAIDPKDDPSEFDKRNMDRRGMVEEPRPFYDTGKFDSGSLS